MMCFHYPPLVSPHLSHSFFILQDQASRLFALAYSMSSHVLVDTESCDLSLDFNFAIAIADIIQVSSPPPFPNDPTHRCLHHNHPLFQIPDGEKSAADRQMAPELFWCLSAHAVSIRASSCPDEISPNNPNVMENYLRADSDLSIADWRGLRKSLRNQRRGS
jgi:hypothetical protein